MSSSQSANPVLNQPEIQAQLHEIQGMLAACMQCGTCTASCPSAPDMDLTPRQMWRLVLMGRLEQLFNSRTFWLCSACYNCTLRCPRGLLLTEAVYALKRLAASSGLETQRKKALFYKIFMENVARYGRVQETKLMSDYMLACKNPLLALQYAPLGLDMLRKGKIHLPSNEYCGVLDELFQTVQDMQEA